MQKEHHGGHLGNEFGDNMMEAFAVRELIDAGNQSDTRYLEFLRKPTMSLGIYQLSAGSNDPQQPHKQDEVYYVISGRSMVHVSGEDRKVTVGDVIFVGKGERHYFHQIDEDLTLLVFFAPAEES